MSVRTLQKWRLQGIGPRFVKLGRAVQYEARDLEEYIESFPQAVNLRGGICEGAATGSERSVSDLGVYKKMRRFNID